MPRTPHDEPDDAHARFEALVLPHLDRMLAFARPRTDSLADAEDVVQEACVRAWQGLAELRDPERARPWLYRILRTVLVDAYDKVGRRRRLVSITRLEDAHAELVGGDADALFDEVVARISGEAVHAALAQIPDDFAAAVELHDIEGFKYHEIAEILGIPLGTVMSRISRGRGLLAGALAPAWSERGDGAGHAAARATRPAGRRGDR